MIGIQADTQRLAFLASASDYEETLNLPYHLLHRYGKITMYSRLVDSHIYIIKKWVIDYLNTVGFVQLFRNYYFFFAFNFTVHRTFFFAPIQFYLNFLLIIILT